MDRLILERAEDIEIYIHPYRTKIMRVMHETGRPMTVKEIADAMGQSPARIHYHVKKLESIGVLYIEHTQLVNGITAKYYDFTHESVGLKVNPKDEKSEELNSRLMWEYGSEFDRVKQGYYDLYTERESAGGMEERGVYFKLEEAYPLDPEKLDAFYHALKKVLKQYKYEGKGAVPHWLFFTAFPNVKKQKEK